MSETLNAETRLEGLSQPGNEAELENTLAAEFSAATTTAESKPADGQTPEKNIADPVKETPQGDEPSKTGSDKAGEAAAPTDRFKQLLADRNEAKSAAAEAQTENQILSKQVSELTNLVEKLAAGNPSERAESANSDDSADDKPLTKKEAKEYVENLLKERSEVSEKQATAEKSIAEEIQALESNKETPNAKEYAEDIKSLMAKHPTISAYAAYRMLQGEGIIPSEGISSNANRTGTGNRSKSSLIKNKNAGDMTQAEREAYLFEEQSAGNLQL